MTTETPSRSRRLREWMRQPPVLMRWKVGVTAIAVLTLASGLFYQTNYRNEQQAHATACARAEGREALRVVLDHIITLSDIFPNSTEIDLYEKSRRAIIEAALPPIKVADCPVDAANP